MPWAFTKLSLDGGVCAWLSNGDNAPHANMAQNNVSNLVVRPKPFSSILCIANQSQIFGCAQLPVSHYLLSSKIAAPLSFVPRKNPRALFWFCNTTPCSKVIVLAPGYSKCPLNEPAAGLIVRFTLATE